MKKQKKTNKKNKQTETERRRKENTTDLIQQHRKKTGSAISLALLYVCICGYHKNFAKILNNYQKCWLTIVITFIAQHLVSAWPSSSLTLYCLLTVWDLSLPETPSKIFWLSYCQSPTLNWLTLVFYHPYFLFWIFTQVHVGSHGYSSLYILAQRLSRQKKIFQTIWHCSKMLKTKIFFILTAIHKYTQRPTHVLTHTHIYIYIYIHECIFLYHK